MALALSASQLFIFVSWLFYDGYNYGEDDDGDVLWSWGEDYYYEFDDLDDAMSSVRYVGPVDNYLRDSVTLFSQEFFKAQEYEIAEDTPSITTWDYNVGSALVTGLEPWTLYE